MHTLFTILLILCSVKFSVSEIWAQNWAIGYDNRQMFDFDLKDWGLGRWESCLRSQAPFLGFVGL